VAPAPHGNGPWERVAAQRLHSERAGQTLTSGFPRSLQKPAAYADTQKGEAGRG